jgi:hypothetical protein
MATMALERSPGVLEGSMAWLPEQIDEGLYVYSLSDAEVRELESALLSFNGLSPRAPFRLAVLTGCRAWTRRPQSLPG